MSWRNRPTFIDYCIPDVDYVMFIDENGDCDLKSIIKNIQNGIETMDNNIQFTMTGVVVRKDDLENIKNEVLELKCRNWEEGYFKYKKNEKRVCFHSREIGRGEGPFSKELINRETFLNELTDVLSRIPANIISSSIDKLSHVKKYCNPQHPYNLCLNFVLERLAKFYLKNNETAIIILEARGKVEDKELLNHIKYTIDNGTRYVNREYFTRIKGIYFNPKWQGNSEFKKSYYGLELADLYSYPIHRYCRLNKKDMSFNVLEHKLYRYPKYDGSGIKKFP